MATAVPALCVPSSRHVEQEPVPHSAGPTQRVRRRLKWPAVVALAAAGRAEQLVVAVETSAGEAAEVESQRPLQVACAGSRQPVEAPEQAVALGQSAAP